MNEQLQAALTAMIEKSLKAFEAGADLLSAEIPDVVQQLMMWHMVQSIAMCCISVLLVLFLTVGNYYQYKWWTHKPDGKHMRIGENYGPTVIVNVFQIILIAMVPYYFNLTWLKIWVAPKIFLIEYAASLVK